MEDNKVQTAEAPSKRGGLRRLDDILSLVEQFGAHDREHPPQWLRDSLDVHGIAPGRDLVFSLIEKRWEMQAPFINGTSTDRRRGQRRSQHQHGPNYPRVRQFLQQMKWTRPATWADVVRDAETLNVPWSDLLYGYHVGRARAIQKLPEGFDTAHEAAAHAALETFPPQARLTELGEAAASIIGTLSACSAREPGWDEAVDGVIRDVEDTYRDSAGIMAVASVEQLMRLCGLAMMVGDAADSRAFGHITSHASRITGATAV